MDFIKYCKENFEIIPSERMIENYDAFLLFHQTNYNKEPSQKLIDSFIKTQIKERISNENHTAKRKG